MREKTKNDLKNKKNSGPSAADARRDPYLEEMEALINRFPEDPNEADLTEAKLNALIDDLDKSWLSFQRKWQTPAQKSNRIPADARLKTDTQGMRHLIIKSEFKNRDLLDLTVWEGEKKLRSK